MALALLTAEQFTVLAVVGLLVGVPLFVVAVLGVVSGYIRYDAARRFEDVEAQTNEEHPAPDSPSER
ncbi:hypothetical protein [Halopiger djelfimassiliensis]|uniref:hypothetical protein n=1 Tax=Halopiger djelfimassiliensis TaxID=1293047 RepID=UPI000677BB14|nr:hypothetical protein [Halopiger djelfimassiliensis]